VGPEGYSPEAFKAPKRRKTAEPAPREPSAPRVDHLAELREETRAGLPKLRERLRLDDLITSEELETLAAAIELI
jgi:hypothetical protein